MQKERANLITFCVCISLQVFLLRFSLHHVSFNVFLPFSPLTCHNLHDFQQLLFEIPSMPRRVCKSNQSYDVCAELLTPPVVAFPVAAAAAAVALR